MEGFDVFDDIFSNSSKSLLVFGDNTHGQLLASNKEKLLSPMILKLPILKEIDEISTGSSHTLIRQGSLLYCCGSNFFGQLGIGSNRKYSDLEVIDYFYKNSISLKSVISGYNQSFFLTEQGKVYCCGYNEEGCLGVTPNSNVYDITEVKIPGNEKITKISIGMYHVLMLTIEDRLLVSGLQNQGQLFLNTKTKNQKSLILNSEMSGKKLEEIGCGQYFSVAFSKELKIYVSGVLSGENSSVFYEFDLNKEFGFSLDNGLPSLICTVACCDDWFLVRIGCEFSLYLEKDYFFKWNNGQFKDVTSYFNAKINEEIDRVKSSRKLIALITKTGKLLHLTNSENEILDKSTEPSLFFISVSRPFVTESLLDCGLLAIIE